MKQLIKVSASDFKLIFRDPSLRVFLFLPALIYLLVNFFLPWLVDRYEGVVEYVPYVLIVATIENTQMFGFIYSMVLIDEKESEVSKVYGVLPVSKPAFALSRLLIPCLLTILLTWLLLIIQPFYTLPLMPALLFSVLAGLIVPVYALGISIFSKNKMEGMVWIKVFNIAVVIPVIAFFLPQPLNLLFTVFPTHWAFQGLSHLIEESTYAWQMLIGFAYFIILLMLSVRWFTKVHYS